MNGLGKIYDDLGRLHFQGNFVNGLKYFEGIEYYNNGVIKSVGNYHNDEFHGIVK